MKGAKQLLALALLLALGVLLVKWLSSTFRIDQRKPGELPGPIVYYEDTTPGHTLGIGDVARLPDSLFEEKSPCCSFGRPGGVIWLRFSYTNRDTAHERFLVEVVNPSIPKIEFFHLNGRNELQHYYRTGTTTGTEKFSFYERPDTHSRNFRFPLGLATGSTAQVYLRLSSGTPLYLRVLFFEESFRLGHHQWVVDILMTIFYVFSALFLILTAILIVASREPFHWYYFLYVLCTALFIPTHLGLGFAYVWKDWPAFQHIAPMALNNLRLIFGIQFFRLFFDLPNSAPRFNRFIDLSIGIFLATLLLQGLPHSSSGWVFYPFFVFLMLFSLGMIAWLIHRLITRPYRNFSWLLTVIVLNFIGVTSTSLQYLGYGSAFFDVADWLMYRFGIADTFFLSPMVIGAFFLEQMLVFNFAVRRYLHLIEKNQKTQLRIAKAREEGLNALILGVENERRRIARDLHDGACVHLAAINMKLDTLCDDKDVGPELGKKMTGIANEIEQTYREIRGISHNLMSKALDKKDLQTALEELCGRIQQARRGLKVDFFSNYPLHQISGLARIHLYRIVQELLANVLKHAQARHANVQMIADGKQLLLSIEDDGMGFDFRQRSADGIGLSNIRTRVEVLHGKLHIESTPGKGTFVSIDIPEETLME